MGTSVVACLRDEGHDAVAVVEVMPQADDEEILARAVFEGRIMVTNDKDLDGLPQWTGASGGGIVAFAGRRGREQGADDEGRVSASRRTVVEPLHRGY